MKYGNMMQNKEKVCFSTRVGMVLLCICALTQLGGCYKITLSVVQAPITSKADWQPVKSTPLRLRYAAPAGNIVLYAEPTMLAQVKPSLTAWFDTMLGIHATRTLNEPQVEQHVLGGRDAQGVYAMAKNSQDDWRRFEAYVLADRVIWVDVDNNIDSKSYADMMTFINELAVKPLHGHSQDHQP